MLLIGFAAIAPSLGGPVGGGFIHGLKLVAVAVVAQAVWDMARRLCAGPTPCSYRPHRDRGAQHSDTVYAQLIVISSVPYSDSRCVGQRQHQIAIAYHKTPTIPCFPHGRRLALILF